MSAYYNEIDLYAAEWLRNLIAAGHIAPGDVDTRSIVDVRPDDIRAYTQCHFFAGIGGWSLAARLAGWPDGRALWTGSCPCQPFSVAGKGEGQADDRHLWPIFFDLIRSCRPDVVMGEQVAAAVGKDWLDGVSSDLESIGYACGAAVVPACAVDAPHRRDRLWFVADADKSREGQGWEQRGGQFGGSGRDTEACAGVLADAYCIGGQVDKDAGRRANGSNARSLAGSGGAHDGNVEDSEHGGRQGWNATWRRTSSALSSGPHWIIGADGKARRVEPGICLLAHGVPSRVAKLRAFGNAIVPQVAAEVIGAFMECRPGYQEMAA